jgi:hypothetical protein
MALSAFDDTASPPGDRALEEMLGRTNSLWARLKSDLQETYGPLIGGMEFLEGVRVVVSPEAEEEDDRLHDAVPGVLSRILRTWRERMSGRARGWSVGSGAGSHRLRAEIRRGPRRENPSAKQADLDSVESVAIKVGH